MAFVLNTSPYFSDPVSSSSALLTGVQRHSIPACLHFRAFAQLFLLLESSPHICMASALVSLGCHYKIP